MNEQFKGAIQLTAIMIVLASVMLAPLVYEKCTQPNYKDIIKSAYEKQDTTGNGQRMEQARKNAFNRYYIRHGKDTVK